MEFNMVWLFLLAVGLQDGPLNPANPPPGFSPERWRGVGI